MRFIGGMFHYKVERDSSLHYFSQAYLLAKKFNNQSEIAKSKSNMGMIYYSQGEFQKAIKHYKESITPFTEAKDSVSLALLYNNIGTTYFILNKADSALLFLYKSLSLKEKVLNKESYAITLTNIADVYVIQQNNILAEETFKEALAIFKNEKSNYNISFTSIRLADYYKNINDYERAIYYLHQAEETATEFSLDLLLSQASKRLAKIYEILDNHKKALTYYKKYKTLDEKIAASKHSKIIEDIRVKYDVEVKDKNLELLANKVKLQQSKTLILYLFLSVSIVIIVILTYFIFLIRKKDKYIVKQHVNTQSFSSQETTEPINKELLEKITDLLVNKKIYLDKELNLKSFSDQLDSNTSYVSKLINTHFNQNFKNLINYYRIQEAKKLLADPKNQNLTIAAIAEQAGFNSLTVFNRVFKNEVGVTPSFFIKEMHNL